MNIIFIYFMFLQILGPRPEQRSIFAYIIGVVGVNQIFKSLTEVVIIYIFLGMFNFITKLCLISSLKLSFYDYNLLIINMI